jgi:hypothetical protein
MSDNQISNGTFCNAITGRPELFLGSGAAQNMVVNDNAVDVDLDVKDNTRYVFTQPLNRLHFIKIANSCFESEVVFKAGAGFAWSFAGNGVKTIGDITAGKEPFIEGTEYLISIRYAEIVAVKFNPAE